MPVAGRKLCLAHSGIRTASERLCVVALFMSGSANRVFGTVFGTLKHKRTKMCLALECVALNAACLALWHDDRPCKAPRYVARCTSGKLEPAT